MPGDDLVFVDNTTTGANAILRSSSLRAGDEILVSDFGYGGVIRAVTYAARECGAIVRTAAMPYPVQSADEVVEAFAAAISPNTKLAVVDHITSESALVLPLAAIAERVPRARRAGPRRRRARARRHPARHPHARRRLVRGEPAQVALGAPQQRHLVDRRRRGRRRSIRR